MTNSKLDKWWFLPRHESGLNKMSPMIPYSLTVRFTLERKRIGREKTLACVTSFGPENTIYWIEWRHTCERLLSSNVSSFYFILASLYCSLSLMWPIIDIVLTSPLFLWFFSLMAEYGMHHRCESCVLIPPASNSCKKFLSTSAEIALGGALHVELEQC